MDKRKFGIRQWVFMGIIAYLIGANLFYFLMLKPISQKLALIKTQKSIAEDYVLLSTARQALEAFQRRLVKPDELNTIGPEIVALARRCNVTPVSVKRLASEEKIGWGFAKIPIRVRLQGGYHNIGNFISKLESSRKIFFIEDLYISNETGEKYEQKAELTLCVIKSVK